MAARRFKIRHDENTRAKIRASQLVNRLQNHVLGKVELTRTQVDAAKTLLGKVLPDLSATKNEHKHDVADPLADLLNAIHAQPQRTIPAGR